MKSMMSPEDDRLRLESSMNTNSYMRGRAKMLLSEGCCALGDKLEQAKIARKEMVLTLRTR